MLYKTTTKLFNGLYQYKIVVITAGAKYFRRTNYYKGTPAELFKAKDSEFLNWFKDSDDLAYAVKLDTLLKKHTSTDVRVESPWLSIYTNDKKVVDAIAKIDKDHVKYISQPPTGTELEVGTIIMKKRDYDYRITLGHTNQMHDAFVSWADVNSNKVMLTKGCRKHLLQDRSWGGTHLYITGDNALLMAKMQLSGSISKIDKIIKAGE